MDKGLLILLSLAVILTITILLEILGIVTSAYIQATMMISLGYHICYTIYAVCEWRGRTRIRNVRRANLRPPGRDLK